MTPAGIHALRKATAIAHATPGLRLRLTHEGEYLAEVGHDVVPRDGVRPARMTPCQLRFALTRVVGEAVVGRNVAAFGLPPGIDPAVQFGVTHDASIVVHPFGLISGIGATGFRVAFATTIDDVTIHSLMHHAVGHPCAEDLTLNIRRDQELGTSVVALEASEQSLDAMIDLGYGALAACGAEEFDASWCGAPRPSHRKPQ